MNRIFHWISIMGLWLLPCFLIAQKATIKGLVVDSAKTGDDAQLIGASIQALQDGKFVTGTATTAEINEETFEVLSKYELQLEPGDYTLKFTNLGYQDLTMQVSLAAGEVKEINVGLTEGTLIDVVVVTGNKSGTSVAKSTVTIDVMGASLVENSAATKVDDAVGKVPGVTVVDGQANIRGGSGYSYGAGSRVLILIDDMPFMQADAGLPNWRDIPVENVDQIEVLKGAASALYGSSALNGIINIRTAYAKKDPVTKLSLYGTAYGLPAMDDIDRERGYSFSRQAWWMMDTVRTSYLIENKDTSYTVPDSAFAPKAFSGPNGYRTPKEFGFQFAHRRKIGKLDLTFGGNLFSQDSPLGGQFERKVRVNTNLRYRVSDSLNFGVALNFNHGLSGSFFLWGNEGVLLDTSRILYDSLTYFSRNGTVTRSKITRFAVDPFFTAFDKMGNRHRVQARVFYVDNQNANNQSNRSVLNYLEYQNQSTFTRAGHLRMVSGIVGQYTFVTAKLYGDAQYHVANAAAYLQLEKGFIKKKDTEDDYKLNFSFGARVEMNVIKSPDSILLSAKDPGVSLNPEPLSIQAKPVFRVGVNYEATPITFIRASWGQGYRYPTVAERYIATSIDVLEIRPNPTLQSETGWSAELGVKQGFQITRKWKGFFDASFFWTEYQNMMEFTFGGGDTLNLGNIGNLFFQSVNIGNTRILGTELTAMGTGDIGPVKMNIMAGYTFIDPRFKDFDRTQQILSTDTTNILKYRSQHTAKMDVEFFFMKKQNFPLSFAVAFQYQSRMRAVDAAFQNLLLGSPLGFQYDAFGIGYYRRNVNQSQNFNLSARIGYRISIMGKNPNDPSGNKKEEKMGIKLSVVGNNLLNQQYTVRPGLMAPPVNFVARLDVDF